MIEQKKNQQKLQQQQKINIDKQNQKIFSQISIDCKNIPFWIPYPEEYADYDPQKLVSKYADCNSSEETIIVSRQLKNKDYQNHKKDYDEHKILYEQTLEESYKQYKQGELPYHCFVRHKCCFNHYLSLPTKLGKELSIFDYELYLVNLLETKKRLSILKARALGITENIIVRYTPWKALSSDIWKGRTGAIVTGIRMDSSVELINRIKRLFTDNFPINFVSKRNEIILNNDVRIISFPSDNVKSLRLYDDFCFIFIDEADFFSIKNQIEIKHVVEGYMLKSQPIIVWISTPNLPGGIMENFQKQYKEKHHNEENNIRKEQHEEPPSSLSKLRNDLDYGYIELPYQVGINQIYDTSLLEQEKLKDYFPREYQLKFGFGLGDVFTEADLQMCQIHQYNSFNWYKDTKKILAIDPGMGSSKFGFMVTELVEDPYDKYNIQDLPNINQRQLIKVLFAEEFERPDPTKMENLTKTLIEEFQILDGRAGGKVVIDGANILYIKKIKEMVNELVDYEKSSSYKNIQTRQNYIYSMQVMPINFQQYQRQMMFILHDYVTKGYVAINTSFGNVLNQMRIAKATPERGLIKEIGGSTYDLLDPLRMSAYVYSLRY